MPCNITQGPPLSCEKKSCLSCDLLKSSHKVFQYGLFPALPLTQSSSQLCGPLPPPDQCCAHPFHSYFDLFVQPVPALQIAPCSSMNPTQAPRPLRSLLWWLWVSLDRECLAPESSVTSERLGACQGRDVWTEDLLVSPWEVFPRDSRKHCRGRRPE